MPVLRGGPVSDPKLTIAEALSAVMGDVQAVGKDSRNTQQNFNFRGIDAVVNEVGPALRNHGVIVLPRVLSSHYRDFNTAKGALMHEAVLEVEFRFVGPDGSALVCSTMGESADSGDKASAKAHSVAYRTALLQALCIPTDDPDPDASTYDRAERQAPSGPPSAAAGNVCPGCGESLANNKPVGRHDGAMWHKDCIGTRAPLEPLKDNEGPF